jgi:hypothetical protein
MVQWVKANFVSDPHPLEDYKRTVDPDGTVRYSRELSPDEEARFFDACIEACRSQEAKQP